MKKTMQHNSDEIISGFVGTFAYVILHIFGVQLSADLSIPHTDYGLVSKCINMVFGIFTACFAFIAVHYLKKIFKDK